MLRRVLVMAGLTASSLAKPSSLAASRGISSSSSTAAAAHSKILYVVRHGQALHNPRAEAAKEQNCSMEEFFRLMREDDALDADLTELGREQARACREAHFLGGGSDGDDGDDTTGTANNPLGIDLVVASCLSRTIDTADLVFPHRNGDDDKNTQRVPRRLSIEDFREVNGNLLNGKRRTKSELQDRHPNWNFDSLVTEEDETWTTEMEDFGDAAERGYRGLVGLLTGDSITITDGTTDGNDNDDSARTILLVCHGGILRYLMNQHPLVQLRDERGTTESDGDGECSGEPRPLKAIESRFDNCELRKYRLSWSDDDVDVDTNAEELKAARRAIVLTQLDH